MKKTRISRRTMLRGLGGVAVGLPVLEIMGSPSLAQASTDANRFVISYAGVSIGSDRSTDTLTIPSTEGVGYEIRRALAPVENMGLQDEVMLVSGLKIPWGSDPSSIPGGRAETTTHYRTYAPQMAGTYTTVDGASPRDSTADVIVADAIGAGTPHDVLRYNLRGGEVSFRGTSAQSSIGSARFAYENLFADGVSTDASDAETDHARFLMRRRTSVLDLVRGNTERLGRRLGRVDARRMDQHLSFIRDLETRLDALTTAPQSSCIVPDDPGVDGDPSAIDSKADVMTRLMATGFACGQSRSASFLQSAPLKSRIPMNWISDEHGGDEMHSFTHGGTQEGLSDAVAWFIKNMCRLSAHLREVPSFDGTSMLDQTAMVLLFEGGHGFDPDSGNDNVAHSTENMVALVFGGAGGLKRGHHIRTDNAHPAQVVLTAMQAVGVATDQLGEVSGALSALRS